MCSSTPALPRRRQRITYTTRLNILCAIGSWLASGGYFRFCAVNSAAAAAASAWQQCYASRQQIPRLPRTLVDVVKAVDDDDCRIITASSRQRHHYCQYRHHRLHICNASILQIALHGCILAYFARIQGQSDRLLNCGVQLHSTASVKISNRNVKQVQFYPRL